MVTQFTPLVAEPLDPRNEEELIQRAKDRTFTASNGMVNDFTPSSPLSAFLEGGAFAQAELLYYANKLPEAMAVEFLKIMGIQRKLGTKATATLIFTLSQVSTSPFTIPEGYQIVDQTGRFIFETDATLVIQAGYTFGSITATAVEVGSQYNVSSYSINRVLQPLSYIASVTNTEPATGGGDAETLLDVKARAYPSIRRRGLVSASDYEEETRALLGVGSTAKAIGNLAEDKVSTLRGTVHVFALNAGAEPLNTAQITQLQAALQNNTHVSVTVFVSNIDVVPLEVSVIATLIPGTNPEVIAQNIYQSLNSYLTPGNLELGDSVLIKQLEFLVQLEGVGAVQSVTQGAALSSRDSTNLALPYAYSAATLNTLTVQLVDGSATYIYAFGQGDPD